MARIGKRILTIPAGVEVKVADGRISVKGPKGTLTQTYLPAIRIEVKDNKVTTLCDATDPKTLALHGLYNSLIKNMLDGVTKGFTKDLDLVGVGYRAQLQGKKLTLALGFSHPVEFDPPPGIEFEVAGGTHIKIKGIDRQAVGQIASVIRKKRKVEPYKGKGIRYFGEQVRRKAGKAAKAGAGAAGA